MFNETYNIKDPHSRIGLALTYRNMIMTKTTVFMIPSFWLSFKLPVS